MHGRLKIKTTAEQEEEKRKEKQKKLVIYNAALKKTTEKRSAGEFDAEAMEMVNQLLLANPDFSTMWNLRKEILKHWKQNKDEEEMQKVMLSEIGFTESCLRVNPKSYGSWFHRLWILQNMPQPNWKKELQLCTKYLELDERNFHCWDYRFLIAKHCQAKAEDELEFTKQKIDSNFSNYSAWHYRSKLLPRIYPDPDKVRTIQQQNLIEEFDLVQNAAFTDPEDPSVWFYHQWLLGQGGRRKLLRYLHADRKNLTLVFTGIITRAELLSKLKMSFNNNEALNWFSPDGFENGSAIWQLTMSDDDLKGSLKLQLKFEEEEVEFVLAEETKQHLFTLDSAAPYVVDRNPLAQPTSALLNHELDSVNQLLELEPDSKWPLLVSVFLMRCLDFANSKHKISSTLDKLIKIEPQRTGFYQDLKSKYVIEGIHDELIGKAVHKLDLNGLHLSRMYHIQYFSFCKEVDLSGNSLRDLRGLNLLVCCEKLNLNNNQLTRLEPSLGLKRLTHLSIANNRLIELDELNGLKGCGNLVELDVSGNPVSGCIYTLEAMLPRLKICNTKRLF